MDMYGGLVVPSSRTVTSSEQANLLSSFGCPEPGTQEQPFPMQSVGESFQL
jgi:hypothetical protein